MKLSGEFVRRLLDRRELAIAEYRSALARRLRLTDGELQAVLHISRAGQLTSSQLAARCQLTSGGTAALVGRLVEAGHVTRHPHPRDRRSSLLRLSPSVAHLVRRADRELVEEIDRIAAELDADEQQAVTRVMERLAAGAEELAASMTAEPPAAREERLVPSLWA